MAGISEGGLNPISMPLLSHVYNLPFWSIMGSTVRYLCLIGLAMLAACQSGDRFLLSSRDEPAPNQQAAVGPQQQPTVPGTTQTPISQAAGEQQGPQVQGPQQSAAPQPINPGSEPAATADSPAADPQVVAEAQTGTPTDATPGDGGVAGQVNPDGARQGSLAQAAGEQIGAETSGNRAVIEPDNSVLGSGFQRQVNALRGGRNEVRILDSTSIDPEKLAGTWTLAEEDGLRQCTMVFADGEDSNGAQVSGGCSPEISGVSSWGVFGDDLLLRDGQNSVVVRLRSSGGTWIGFTLQSGIPIVLSRT